MNIRCKHIIIDNYKYKVHKKYMSDFNDYKLKALKMNHRIIKTINNKYIEGYKSTKDIRGILYDIIRDSKTDIEIPSSIILEKFYIHDRIKIKKELKL